MAHHNTILSQIPHFSRDMILKVWQKYIIEGKNSGPSIVGVSFWP